jgi:hypothetical protein
VLDRSAAPFVFALASWTIREDARGRYFICRTGSNAYGKPYSSLRRACTAIARKLEEEYATRRQRLADAYAARR